MVDRFEVPRCLPACRKDSSRKKSWIHGIPFCSTSSETSRERLHEGSRLRLPQPGPFVSRFVPTSNSSSPPRKLTSLSFPFYWPRKLIRVIFLFRRRSTRPEWSTLASELRLLNLNENERREKLVDDTKAVGRTCFVFSTEYRINRASSDLQELLSEEKEIDFNFALERHLDSWVLPRFSPYRQPYDCIARCWNVCVPLLFLPASRWEGARTLRLVSLLKARMLERSLACASLEMLQQDESTIWSTYEPPKRRKRVHARKKFSDRHLQTPKLHFTFQSLPVIALTTVSKYGNRSIPVMQGWRKNVRRFNKP